MHVTGQRAAALQGGTACPDGDKVTDMHPALLGRDPSPAALPIAGAMQGHGEHRAAQPGADLYLWVRLSPHMQPGAPQIQLEREEQAASSVLTGQTPPVPMLSAAPKLYGSDRQCWVGVKNGPKDSLTYIHGCNQRAQQCKTNISAHFWAVFSLFRSGNTT